jgi:hypothetical protein
MKDILVDTMKKDNIPNSEDQILAINALVNGE